MNSELQIALDKWDTHPNSILVDDRNLFIDAARKVANPDIAAIAEALAVYAGYDGLGPGPEYWRGMAKEAVAALGIEDPTICVHCGGTGAGEVQTPWKTNPCHHCGGSGEAPDG